MQSAITARIVMLDPSGRMLIVKRSRSDPLYAGAWDMPGGQVDEGETIEMGAAREALEEVGLQLQRPQLIFATSDMRSGTSKSWLFFVEEVPANMVVVLSDEHEAYQWIKPEELTDYTDYDILLRFHTYVTNANLFARQTSA